jgi:actin-like ATPase involved in cell morphogenesis
MSVGSSIEGVKVDDREIREALAECVAAIVNAIRVALEAPPPVLEIWMRPPGPGNG